MKLIDKDALVAEIERLRKNQRLDDRHGQGVLDGLHAIERFIDPLEVEEVDLDRERRKYLTEHFNVYEDGILQSKRSNLPLDTYDVIKIAKHFFELGLKAQHDKVKEVDLELITGWFDHVAQMADDRKTLNGEVMEDWAALDEIKCLAKNSSEFITKHYKAQKGEKVC